MQNSVEMKTGLTAILATQSEIMLEANAQKGGSDYLNAGGMLRVKCSF